MSSKMIASSVSFHCMICFEEFDTERIYPVVLPCGHTYICVLCANRIDKCMECRASLFAEHPSPAVGQSQSQAEEEHYNNNYNYSNRGGGGATGGGGGGIGISRGLLHATAVRSGRRTFSFGQSRSFPSNIHLGGDGHGHGNNGNGNRRTNANAKQQRVRLPLPKNVVLLSLIESSIMVKNNAQKSSLHNPHLLCRSVSSNRGLIYTDDMSEEEHRIVLSADVATGTCGTYAVNTQHGLVILPAMDMDVNDHDGDDEDEDEAREYSHDDAILRNDSITTTVDDIVQHFSRDDIHHDPSSSHPIPGRPTSPSGTLRLQYGDRVQVVAIVDSHWAKLARGYGYVYFENSRDLIKVGGVLDKACSIEAMIYSFSHGREKLQRAKDHIEQDAFGLMNKLQATLLHDEDLTVIGAEAFHSGSGGNDSKAGSGKDATLGVVGEGRDGCNNDHDHHNEDTGDNLIHGQQMSRSKSRSSVYSQKPRPEHIMNVNHSTSTSSPTSTSSQPLSLSQSHPQPSSSPEVKKPPKKKPASLLSPFNLLDYALCAFTSNCGGSNIRHGDGDRYGGGGGRGHGRGRGHGHGRGYRDGNVNDNGDFDDAASTNTANSLLASSRGSGHGHGHGHVDHASSSSSQSSIVRAAQEWRLRNGVEESHSAHIDFRTGLSGHRGLGGDNPLRRSYSLSRDNSTYSAYSQGGGGGGHGHGYRMSDHCALTPKRIRQKQRRGSDASDGGGGRRRTMGRSSYV